MSVGIPLLLAALLAGGWLFWRNGRAPDVVALQAPTEAVAAPAPVASVAAVAAQRAPVVDAAPVPEPMAPSAGHTNEPPLLASAAGIGQPVTSVVVPPVSNEGRVRLAIAPWGEIYVDNRKVGVSPPLSEIKVSPGKHTIEVRNGSFDPYQQSVNLTANASVRIKHKFE